MMLSCEQGKKLFFSRRHGSKLLLSHPFFMCFAQKHRSNANPLCCPDTLPLHIEGVIRQGMAPHAQVLLSACSQGRAGESL